MSRLETMLGLTERRRGLLADKVSDVANLIAAAIVIGLMLGEPDVSLTLVFSTLVIWIVGTRLCALDRRT